MKTTIFYLSLTAGLFLCMKSTAAPVTGGGSAAAAPAPRITVPPSAPLKPVPGTPPGLPAPVQNGVGSINGANGTLTGNGTFTSTSNQMTGATNSVPGSNGLTGMSNNSSSVTATVNPTSNGIVKPATDINGNPVVNDHATTPSDRVLLTTLSQGVRATLGITPNGNMPVHFMINNGTVTVVGTVQSSAQSQGILSQVQQTPGVLSVINDMHVASPFGVAQTGSGQTGIFAGPSDHAFSAPDRALLTAVQQQAATQLGVNSTAQMPVHFSVQNGVVGVTGQVSSPQEKQALLAAIGRTPGIVRVVDNVGVINGAQGMNNGAANMNNGNLPATSNPGQSNTIFLNSTNSSGF